MVKIFGLQEHGIYSLIWEDGRATEEFHKFQYDIKKSLVLGYDLLIPINLSEEREEIIKFINYWKEFTIIPERKNLEKLENEVDNLIKPI